MSNKPFFFHSKAHSIQFMIFIILLFLSGCNLFKQEHTEDSNLVSPIESQDEVNEVPPTLALETETEIVSEREDFSYITTEGMTLERRINVPEGYTRIPSSINQITGFMRNLTLKNDGSKVLLYDGSKKSVQSNHIAIFDLDVGDRNLQQCADSIMRIYAEYYWSIGDYDKIAFHLTNGFFMEYTKWRDGNRIIVDGNDVSWSKTKELDDSYEVFRNYLNMVYSYAGTLSLSQECKAIGIEDILPGDLFIQGGSPGHCILVVDIAADEDGNCCYLLAQGYMPAQDFHILKNSLHPENPWFYSSEITYPFQTPSWTFKEGSLMRWSEFSLESEESE